MEEEKVHTLHTLTESIGRAEAVEGGVACLVSTDTSITLEAAPRLIISRKVKPDKRPPEHMLI